MKINDKSILFQAIIVTSVCILISIVLVLCFVYPFSLKTNANTKYEFLNNIISSVDVSGNCPDDDAKFAYAVVDANSIIMSINVNESTVSPDTVMSIARSASFSSTIYNYEVNGNDIEDKIYCASVRRNDGKNVIVFVNNNLNSNLFDSSTNIPLTIAIIICLLVPLIGTLIWIKKFSYNIIKLNNYLLNYDNDFNSRPDAPKEVIDLYQNFEKYRKNLIEKENEKQVLFQNISHELKTPITSIKLLAEGIEDGVYKNDNLADSAHAVITEADKLLEKVNKIMQINKISYYNREINNRVKITDTVNICDILFEEMNSYSDLYKDVKFTAKIDESYVFRGQVDIWKNIIQNIFDNNIRYGAKNIEIIVNEKYLFIENDGEKIEIELLNKLFEPFVKGKKGNFGLGLSIIKKSLEMYNYSIKISNTIKGVIYEITDKQ